MSCFLFHNYLPKMGEKYLKPYLVDGITMNKYGRTKEVCSKCGKIRYKYWQFNTPKEVIQDEENWK